MHILRKFGFGLDFISWIKMILNNQESCNINGRKAKKYSKLERRDQQGDPISAYKYLSQKYFLYLLKITLRLKVLISLNMNFYITLI